MFKVTDEEVTEVLTAMSEEIDELIQEYKINRNEPEFEPVVQVYPIASEGFIALFQAAEDNVIASVLSFEGRVTYTIYGSDRDLMH